MTILFGRFETGCVETGRFKNRTLCKPDVLKPDVLKPDVLWVYPLHVCENFQCTLLTSFSKCTLITSNYIPTLSFLLLIWVGFLSRCVLSTMLRLLCRSWTVYCNKYYHICIFYITSKKILDTKRKKLSSFSTRRLDLDRWLGGRLHDQQTRLSPTMHCALAL